MSQDSRYGEPASNHGRPSKSPLLEAIRRGPLSKEEAEEAEKEREQEWHESVERWAADPPIEQFRCDQIQRVYSAGTEEASSLQTEAERCRNVGLDAVADEVDKQLTKVRTWIRETLGYLNSPEFEVQVSQAWAEIVHREAELWRQQHDTQTQEWVQKSSAEFRERLAAIETVGQRLLETDELRARLGDGPCEGGFRYEGRWFYVPGIRKKLLDYVWDHGQRPKSLVGKHLWEEEWDETKLSTTVNRLNNDLVRTPWKVKVKGDRVILEKRPG